MVKRTINTKKCVGVCKDGKKCTRGATRGDYCAKHVDQGDHAEIEAVIGCGGSESVGDESTDSGNSEYKDINCDSQNDKDDRVIIDKLVVEKSPEENCAVSRRKYKKKKKTVYIHPSVVSGIAEFVKDFMKAHPRAALRDFQNIVSTSWKENKKVIFEHVELNEYQKFMRDSLKLLDEEMNHKDKVRRIGEMWKEKKAKKLECRLRET